MKELIVKNAPKSPISEAYRSVRTNIEFANIDQTFKTIMFTSATAGEGKTTSLCNVAMTMIDAGKKVIIVDCDLRKPRIHKFFEISNKRGVSEMLLSGEPYQGYVQTCGYSNLEVITAGHIPGSPSELLSSKAMKQFMLSLKADYDYIFVDCPPVVPVTDGVILSTFIDRVILVCASGEVQIDFAKKAQTSLESVGAKVLGVMLNKVQVDSKKYAYYYYYKSEEDKR